MTKESLHQSFQQDKKVATAVCSRWNRVATPAGCHPRESSPREFPGLHRAAIRDAGVMVLVFSSNANIPTRSEGNGPGQQSRKMVISGVAPKIR